jgi:arylsulfatase A-like enzyme
VVGADDRPPNIVLIISDDQAWTDFGFMGHDAIVESEVFEWVQQLLT